MFKQIILIGITGIALSGCQTLLPQPKADQSDQITKAMVSAARESASQGQIQETLPFYEQLMQRNPKNAGLAMDYAKLLRREGQEDKALSVLKPFIVREAADSAMLTEYARLFLLKHDPLSAKTYAQQAFSADPDSVPAMLILSAALTLTDQADQAEILLRSAQNRAPQEWQDIIANNLALVLASRGNLTGAQVQMDKAVELTTRYTDKVDGNQALINALESAPKP